MCIFLISVFLSSITDSTLSPAAFTVTCGPGESGSSAADSGWRISVMGFCPELARPFGAPTLILRLAGRCVSETGLTTLRLSASVELGTDRGSFFFLLSYFQEFFT